jgi:uncharacterized protein (TIGR03663 family)
VKALPAGPAAVVRAGRVRVRAAVSAYEVAFAGVATVALALRLVRIADKPFHHDESEHAWFSWLIVTGHGYHYDPVFHGPVQFYVTTLMYMLAGVGDFAARLGPALAGTTIVLLPYFLRRRLGATAALAAAVVLCISPSYLYFSRFAREDIYAACITLALIVAVFRFLAWPRRWHPSLVIGLLAVAFAVKETAYITVFAGGTFFTAVVAAQAWQAWRAGRRVRDTQILRAVRSVGGDAWMWGITTFAAVYTLLFTTFLTNPRGLQNGVVDSIRYWLSQQPVHRGGNPWFYYLVLLPGYEWPVLLLALLGAGAVVRRPTLLGAFLIWFFALSLLVYSWASERVPWLVLHPLLPAALLAGLGVQTLWRARRRYLAKLGIAVTLAGAAYAVEAAIEASYVRPADPRELLVFVQTSTDVPPVADEILSLEHRAVRRVGHAPTIELDGWGGVGWPWGWYLRDVPVAYPDMSRPGYVPSGDVVVVADSNRGLVAPQLKGYVGRRFRLRVWWVPDWGGAGFGDWVRWLVFRRAWNARASLDEWLYVRRKLVPARS